MDSARWERIQELFHEAASLPAAGRRVLVEARCGDDPELAAEVLALLEEDARESPLLDGGLARVAHGVLDDGPAPAPPAGDFGAYRIRGVLGEGGMGVVYLAERADLDTLAAVKVLRDAWLSPSRRERFAAEQRTLAQLNHPSIARLYDAGTLAGGTPWIVMEYVDGVPITQHCRERASPLEERLRLFREVCEAVQHAHLHLVVHRDLKPSNILVGRDGGVKLLDFGIAKQLAGPDAPVDQTRTGVRLLTPAYAAPEQVSGGPVGVHTDVYALGVVLYELLAGRLPFDLSSRSPAGAEAVLLTHEPEKPSMAARRAAGAAGGATPVPAASRAGWADLDVLCLTAMRKDPARRYRTVEALVRDVDHFLRGEPLEARPDGARYRAGKFVRRNRRAVAAAAAAAALLVGLVAFYTLRLADARNDALAEAARAQRIQGYTLGLLSGGDEAAGPADSLRVVTLIDRGVREARALDAEPAAQAELLHSLGEMYRGLGRLDGADSLLGETLERRRARLGGDHPDVAASLVALGLLRSDQARYEEAEALVRQALDIGRRRLPPGHPAVVQASEALGHVLVERGEYDAAIPVFEEVVRRREGAGGAPGEVAGSLYELANVHFYAGHWAASDSLNRRVLAVYRRLHGERHPAVADVLVNLGAIRHEQGSYAEAERFYRRALEIKRGWYGGGHPAIAAGLTMLARPLIFRERLDEAAELLGEALAINERVFGGVHPRVASTLNELGSVALRRERYDEAEAAYRRMGEIYRRVYGGEHYLMGIATSNLASVHTARGEHARAEPLYREAAATFSRTLSPGHLNTGIARIKLGRALLRQGRAAEAERESRAGYDIVRAQASPSVTWLAGAREDLAAAYDALGRPADAARFRAESAAADTAKQAEEKSGG